MKRKTYQDDDVLPDQRVFGHSGSLHLLLRQIISSIVLAPEYAPA